MFFFECAGGYAAQRLKKTAGIAAPSQSATPVSPGAQADESQENLEYAVNVFAQAATNIPENFVMPPDALFQTVALLLLHVGADGANEQLSQIYLGEDCSEQSGATASGATASGATASGAAARGRRTYSATYDVFAARPLEPLAVYKQRVLQIIDDIRSNGDYTYAEGPKRLAQEFNKQFFQLTRGMIRDYCNRNPHHLDASVELLSSFYLIGLWRKSVETHRAHGANIFCLPRDQADAVQRIMFKKTNQSQYAHLNDWQAFTFPYQEDHEIILVQPPEGIPPYALRTEILRVLLSSLDAEESFPSSSTVTSELPFPDVDINTDQNEALSRSGSGLLAAVTSDLSSGAMPAVPVRMSMFSKQAAPSAASTRAGSKRTHEGNTIPSIRFDRPVIYILRHKIKNRIIYIGQILFPGDDSSESSTD
ncbi:serpin family protein [Endozoicomonas sp. 4G]|uniref:serpin family protein n=1 Tax=Endozoicomonas sp. 4G TaxID=2872754 RepID=UPI0020785BE8|nr:serpin family protein [Endozoicomonas sp. 4G]